MFYVYILKSLKTNTNYYGYTSNLEKRLAYHNSGKSKYTKSKRPWKIIYSEVFETKHEAMEREKYFKSIEGYRWLKEKNII
ncbi:MAG: endonuclease [Ignavibacteria bacterium RBG_13_36_8]|nr:MAG: endonuclease [Ignavibacteria bacterium RBG_13_36_8]